ncbi:hypothetical protein BDE02_01G236000 [Populus trichocarpa]|nr:hypothetical protein BDE02_01G236000 [Populus trichocarpa]
MCLSLNVAETTRLFIKCNTRTNERDLAGTWILGLDQILLSLMNKARAERFVYTACIQTL